MLAENNKLPEKARTIAGAVWADDDLGIIENDTMRSFVLLARMNFPFYTFFVQFTIVVRGF
jgi:hypothetical protein